MKSLFRFIYRAYKATKRMMMYDVVGFFYRHSVKYPNTGKIALCCIAKMENEYIRFFVEYYQKLHFDKIIIYDNNDLNGERFETVIGDYIQSGFVEVIDFRGKVAPQQKAYQNCYDKFNKDYDWIAFFDCDEYLTFVDAQTDIHSFLKQNKFLPYQVVHINWKVYGDNEQFDTDGRSIIERFKDPVMPIDFKTKYTSFPENDIVKSVVRGGLRHIICDAHTPRSKYYSCCDTTGSPVRLNASNQPFNFSVAYLRHYSTKTIGEWVRTKMIRGDVHHSGIIASEKASLDYFFRLNRRTEEKIRYAESLMKKNLR